MDQFHSTTILCVRRDGRVAIAGDGQVTLGQTVAKQDAVKVRKIDDVGADRKGVLVGFAGSAADAFALLERFEAKLKESPANLLRAAIERRVEQFAAPEIRADLGRGMARVGDAAVRHGYAAAATG